MGGESAGESARIWVEYEVIRQGRGRGEGWIKSRSPCVGGWQMEGVKGSWRESKKNKKQTNHTDFSGLDRQEQLHIPLCQRRHLFWTIISSFFHFNGSTGLEIP